MVVEVFAPMYTCDDDETTHTPSSLSSSSRPLLPPCPLSLLDLLLGILACNTQAYLPVHLSPVDAFLNELYRAKAADQLDDIFSALSPLAEHIDTPSAVGLFATHSKINHSCAPNAFVVGHAMESVLPVIEYSHEEGETGGASNKLTLVAREDIKVC